MIVSKLKQYFPSPGTVWSDAKDPAPFAFLTGVTHRELLKKWFLFNELNQPDFKTVGPDPGFTTCTGFAPVLFSRVLQELRLPGRNFGSANMRVMPGWETMWMADFFGGPRPGDFYMVTTGGSSDGEFHHVAVIAEVQGGMWSVVGGGAGGRPYGHDGVSRSEVKVRPPEVAGCLNIDMYFRSLGGPYAAVAQEEDEAQAAGA